MVILIVIAAIIGGASYNGGKHECVENIEKCQAEVIAQKERHEAKDKLGEKLRNF